MLVATLISIIIIEKYINTLADESRLEWSKIYIVSGASGIVGSILMLTFGLQSGLSSSILLSIGFYSGYILGQSLITDSLVYKVDRNILRGFIIYGLILLGTKGFEVEMVLPITVMIVVSLFGMGSSDIRALMGFTLTGLYLSSQLVIIPMILSLLIFGIANIDKDKAPLVPYISITYFTYYIVIVATWML